MVIGIVPSFTAAHVVAVILGEAVSFVVTTGRRRRIVALSLVDDAIVVAVSAAHDEVMAGVKKYVRNKEARFICSRFAFAKRGR
jgi:hypothetical protein